MLVFILLCFGTPFAQEDEGGLFMAVEVEVKPSMVAEYEAHIKEVLELVKKHDFPFPYYIFITDDFTVYWVFPLKSFADVDLWYKAVGEWTEKMGSAFYADMVKRTVRTYTKERFFTFRLAPELSYVPKDAPLEPGDTMFFYQGICSLIPGKEEAVGQYFKKFVEMYKSHDSPLGWSTYIGDVGMDVPVYFYVEYAKSAADFYTQMEKEEKEFGKESMELWMKAMKCFRKYEYKLGTLRLDLSNPPAQR
jgi:hypothetical protein